MGDFVQTTFCGASIINFSSSLGLGNQQSQLTVNLVEDDTNGDSFVAPEIGHPITFEAGDFEFRGLVQDWHESNSSDGKPVFEVILVDPREILSGAHVIIDAYNNATSAIPNLYNAYGYWESFMFGYSSVNENGMPWHLIKSAILNLIDSPGIFGGKLQFRGQSYNLNLGELPDPPANYRIGGVSTTLLDAIDQVCTDGGHDYFVKLVGNTITIKTMSRINQPSLTAIESFIDTHSDDVISNKHGRELRNERGSFFLIGGQVAELHKVRNTGLSVDTASIWPYWGKDCQGNVILGTGLDDNHQMQLNAAEIVEIIGQLYYPATVLELRCALVNFDTWTFYIAKYKRDFLRKIDIPSLYLPDSAKDAVVKIKDFLLDYRENNMGLFARSDESDHFNRLERIYEFVRKYAEEYYGRQWLVRIPYVLKYRDGETGEVIYSREPVEGGYQGEGTEPLGLSELNEDHFRHQDGRFMAFVKFDHVGSGVDLRNIDMNNVVIQYDPEIPIPLPRGSGGPSVSMFMKCTVDPEIIETPEPAVLVTLPHALHTSQNVTGYAGDVSVLAKLFGFEDDDEDKEEKTKNILERNLSAIGLSIYPKAIGPSQAAIPLLKRRETYGPWYRMNPQGGQIHVEQDENLVPWNFGGYVPLASAAEARVEDGVTNMVIGEMGSIELAGAPLISLGDRLIADGPNVTNITVQYGGEGVTTTYTLRTFTPQFGVFARANYERIRKLGLSLQRARYKSRAAFRERMKKQAQLYAMKKFWYQHHSKAVKKDTPHDFVISRYHEGSGVQVFQTCFATVDEAFSISRTRNRDLYRSTGLFSLDGLFLPFTVDASGIGVYDHYGSGVNAFRVMDQFAVPSGQAGTMLTDIYSTQSNVYTLNPLQKYNLIQHFIAGSGYDGKMHAIAASGVDYAHARGVAFRLPAVGAGWGFDIYGGQSQFQIKFASGVQPEHLYGSGISLDVTPMSFNDPTTWPAGPIDLRWDSVRKVWGAPAYILHGRTVDNAQGDISAFNEDLDSLSPSGYTLPSGLVQLYDMYGLPNAPTIYATNWFSSDIDRATKVQVGYVLPYDMWQIVSVDC